MIFVGENLQAKVAQNYIGKVWRNSGKILRTPKYLPAPTPMLFDSGHMQHERGRPDIERKYMNSNKAQWKDPE